MRVKILSIFLLYCGCGMEQTSFSCCICSNSRFVSFQPHCDHKVCAICAFEMFAAENLNKKCVVCNENSPQNLDEYKVSYHKISDLKPGEYDAAAFIAALEGHTDVLELLSKEKICLNRVLEDGSTPVFVAAYKGHTDMVKLLAKEKVDLNRAMKNGATPVYFAAQEGNIEIVKFLANQKVDLDRPTDDGTTPLFIAAQEGHADIVKFLAKEKVVLNQARRDGTTPVMIAACYGSTEIVKLFLQLNVKVEKSLLSLAATEEIKEIIFKALQKK